MDRHQTRTNELEEMQVNTKLILAALWASFMFMYIYVDYFHLYVPGSLNDILVGRVFTFEINEAFALAGLASVTIPAMMIFSSVTLPSSVNRLANIVIATIYISYSLFNVIGETWPHIFFGAAVEVMLLLFIIHYALKWPRTEIEQN